MIKFYVPAQWVMISRKSIFDHAFHSDVITTLVFSNDLRLR